MTIMNVHPCYQIVIDKGDGLWVDIREPKAIDMFTEHASKTILTIITVYFKRGAELGLLAKIQEDKETRFSTIDIARRERI